MTAAGRLQPAFAVAAIALLASPPMRALLEATMTRHMLVQLPLLALAGALAAGPWHAPARQPRWLRSVNGGGAAGLLFAGSVLVLWMLPRMLDAAVADPVYALAKFLSVPAASAAVAVSWARCPPVARALVHVEAIAMLLRFGWGYVEAPQRLCVSYLSDDQWRAGALLIVCGSAYAAVVVLPVLAGVRWRPAAWGH